MNNTDNNISIARARLIGGVVSLVGIVTTNLACTHFIASRLNYHPDLGAPWLGIFYPPFAWWTWIPKYYSADTLGNPP